VKRSERVPESERASERERERESERDRERERDPTSTGFDYPMPHVSYQAVIICVSHEKLLLLQELLK